MFKKCVFLILLFSLINTYCMEQEEKAIVINGITATLSRHIQRASGDDTHFKDVKFLRYENEFTCSPISELKFTAQDKAHIKNNNYIISRLLDDEKRKLYNLIVIGINENTELRSSWIKKLLKNREI